MNYKISGGMALTLMILTAVVTFIITNSYSRNQYNQKLSKITKMEQTYYRLAELSDCVEKNYFNEIDQENLMNGILKGYVYGLNDKYADYMTAEEYQEDINYMQGGSMVGIGISVAQNEQGYIEILDIYENSPAASSDIQIGDLISEVDGSSVVGKDFEESTERVRGEEGTYVNLTLLRNGEEIHLKIQRKHFEYVLVHYELLEGNVGYIKIDTFKENTLEQYKKALEQLKKDGAKSVIFDVRNNGGGYLHVLTEVADPLLPEGDIAYAEYKNGKNEVIMTSDSEELDLPMLVLINEGTASAAELFSASLRDFGKAKLVGVNSFGKGIMQDTFDLSDGTAVTLTVAEYRTAKSDCYHGVGLAPDYEIQDDAEQEGDEQLEAALKIIQDET